ncbi:MAG: rod shape-determining protein MreD [Myxococcales bacterium]|nr:rod shape-determining protein MreD [Myxococcales bacterium]
MRGTRASIIIVAVVFAILLLQSVFSGLLAPHPFSPYFGLPFVFALGTAPGIPVLRGAATAFAIGYFYDFFSGNPLGLHTFVFVVGYFSASLIGYLLSFRGIVFEMVLTFVLTLLLGGLLELIRGFTPGGIARSGGSLTIALFASSFATALLAPILFALVRGVDPESERAPT